MHMKSSSSITIKPRRKGARGRRDLPPVHPGEILLHDFLEPMGLSQYALSRATGLPAPRISEIIRGRRVITGETALRLARFFGTSPEWWMNMQAFYDLEVARVRFGTRVVAEVRPRRSAA